MEHWLKMSYGKMSCSQTLGVSRLHRMGLLVLTKCFSIVNGKTISMVKTLAANNEISSHVILMSI